MIHIYVYVHTYIQGTQRSAAKAAVQGLPLSPRARYHIREALPGASPPPALSHSPFCSPQHLTTLVEEGSCSHAGHQQATKTRRCIDCVMNNLERFAVTEHLEYLSLNLARAVSERFVSPPPFPSPKRAC